MIEADALSKMWSADAGLRPVSFTVAAGELVVVRGRSGSGKSTLLAVLAGLCVPDSGAASVAGHAPHPDAPWSRLAIVPQVLGLAPELTIEENVTDAIGGRRAGVALGDLFERLDLAALADRGLDQVSMGQQQRAAVARAVAVVPKVLLVDEPTSYQDGRHAEAVVAELRRAAAAGAAVLAATHDELVTAAADRVLELTT